MCIGEKSASLSMLLGKQGIRMQKNENYISTLHKNTFKGANSLNKRPEAVNPTWKLYKMQAEDKTV